MNSNIKWLRDKIKLYNMQGIIISNPVNIRYLTGIQAEGTLLITRKENYFVTDGRYIEEVNNIITIDDEIIVMDIRNISSEDNENFFNFCENVGFEENFVTYATYKKFMHTYKINNFVEAECLMDKLRMIKDEGEINSIRKACEITDNCFSFLTKYIKPGMTEIEIAKKIEQYYLENAEGISFDTIVASGENSSKPHAIPSDRKIEEKDIITIDMGCKYNGYCSDMTRTIFVGEPTDDQKKIYNLVLESQEKVLDEMKDGANIKDLTKIVTTNFELYDYDLVHALGHGVGLEIHENPVLRTTNDNNLREKMVVTDEPGIYIAGNFGVRIEDTVLITKEGNEVLTKSNKDYIII